ncbi:hypothetical protein TrRE_jg9766, partial [Triparma retinervis]
TQAFKKSVAKEIDPKSEMKFKEGNAKIDAIAAKRKRLLEHETAIKKAQNNTKTHKNRLNKLKNKVPLDQQAIAKQQDKYNTWNAQLQRLRGDIVGSRFPTNIGISKVLKSDKTDTLRIKITELETKLSSNSLSEIEKDRIIFELDTCLVDINNHSAEIDNLIIGIKQLGNDIVAINQRLDVELKGIYETFAEHQAQINANKTKIEELEVEVNVNKVKAAETAAKVEINTFKVSKLSVDDATTGAKVGELTHENEVLKSKFKELESKLGAKVDELTLENEALKSKVEQLELQAHNADNQSLTGIATDVGNMVVKKVAKRVLTLVGPTPTNTQPAIEGKPATRDVGKEGKENAGRVIDL